MLQRNPIPILFTTRSKSVSAISISKNMNSGNPAKSEIANSLNSLLEPNSDQTFGIKSKFNRVKLDNISALWESESARKKTQVTLTVINVTKRPIHESFFGNATIFEMKCSDTKKNPWRNPQMIKVNEEPCHKPEIVKVSRMLKIHLPCETWLPPNGMYT